MNRAILAADIKRAEGYKAHPYRCTEGVLTIGHGFNIDPESPGSGLTAEECDLILHHRLTRLEVELIRALPWVTSAPEPVQHGLMDMAYQMGMAGLRTFNKTLALLRSGDYEDAAREALDSKWARQTPNRARAVSDLFRQAAWDEGVRASGT